MFAKNLREQSRRVSKLSVQRLLLQNNALSSTLWSLEKRAHPTAS